MRGLEILALDFYLTGKTLKFSFSNALNFTNYLNIIYSALNVQPAAISFFSIINKPHNNRYEWLGCDDKVHPICLNILVLGKVYIKNWSHFIQLFILKIYNSVYYYALLIFFLLLDYFLSNSLSCFRLNSHRLIQVVLWRSQNYLRFSCQFFVAVILLLD